MPCALAKKSILDNINGILENWWVIHLRGMNALMWVVTGTVRFKAPEGGTTQETSVLQLINRDKGFFF